MGAWLKGKGKGKGKDGKGKDGKGKDGKGKGCKGKGKGKGKCKRSAWDAELEGERIAMTAVDTVCEDGWVLAMEPSAPPGRVEETELSKAKQLEEMGFDASEVSEALKNCGGDL